MKVKYVREKLDGQNTRASGTSKMKITEIAAYLKKTVADMEEFAARNDDLDLPNQIVLPFIMNFLTNKSLRELSPRVNDASRH